MNRDPKKAKYPHIVEAELEVIESKAFGDVVRAKDVEDVLFDLTNELAKYESVQIEMEDKH